MTCRNSRRWDQVGTAKDAKINRFDTGPFDKEQYEYAKPRPSRWLRNIGLVVAVLIAMATIPMVIVD